MKKYLTLFLLLALGFVQMARAEDATLYLVRHAEKLADSDPGLTEQGHARAAALAVLLKDVGVSKVYSTDYKRTRQTAEPVAKQKGLEISLYNPRAFQEFATGLKAEFLAEKKPMLVVGHSNTTPYLATLLTGKEFPMLSEDQYDHIYKVTIAEDGSLQAAIELFNP